MVTVSQYCVSVCQQLLICWGQALSHVSSFPHFGLLQSIRSGWYCHRFCSAYQWCCCFSIVASSVSSQQFPCSIWYCADYLPRVESYPKLLNRLSCNRKGFVEITTEVTANRNRKEKYSIEKQRCTQLLRKFKEFEILFYTLTIKIHI